MDVQARLVDSSPFIRSLLGLYLLLADFVFACFLRSRLSVPVSPFHSLVSISSRTYAHYVKLDDFRSDVLYPTSFPVPRTIHTYDLLPLLSMPNFMSVVRS